MAPRESSSDSLTATEIAQVFAGRKHLFDGANLLLSSELLKRFSGVLRITLGQNRRLVRPGGLGSSKLKRKQPSINAVRSWQDSLRHRVDGERRETPK